MRTTWIVKLLAVFFFVLFAGSAGFAQTRTNSQSSQHQVNVVSRPCVHGSIHVSRVTQTVSRVSDPPGSKAYTAAQYVRGRDALGCKLQKSDEGRYNGYNGQDLPGRRHDLPEKK